MKKTGLLFCLVTMITLAAKAQDYKNAIGIRFGPNTAAVTAGITYKRFLNDKAAFEGIMGVNDGFSLCALYEIHFPIGSVTNLQWFVGPGAYVSSRSNHTSFGVAGIIGLDYKFEDLPLNLSFDWKPELNLISDVHFESSGLGLSARFTF